MEQAPTEKQIELMSHALGADQFYQNKGFYRNRFAASPDTPDDKEWKKLVEMGYAAINEGAAGMNNKLIFYYVTDKGDAFIREDLRQKKHAKSKRH